MREAYDSVIKDKLENNIIEEVTDTEINNISKEFYMLHRAVIHESAEIHEFSEKLLSSVQALETMEKLKEINGYARLTVE